MSDTPAHVLRDQESILLVDRKDRTYLRRLRAGKRISVRGRPLPCDALIGQPEGCSVANDSGESFSVFRPSYAQLIPQLPRQSQPIYPKDVGALLLWGDVAPGMSVIEIGVGAGALTLALLRGVGPTGALTSYEMREDFAEITRENVARHHGEAPNWALKVRDATAGLDETEVDRIVIDVPEPWTLVPEAAKALRPGGILTCFLPTMLQIKTLTDCLHEHPAFDHVETIETFLREWHARGRSLRPAHRMVAHTGLLVLARRVPTRNGATLTPLNPYSSETDDPVTARESRADDEGRDSGDGVDSN